MIKNIVLILAVVASAAISITAQGSDDAAFKAIVKQMTDAQTNYDAAALNRIYTEDFIEISPVGEFDPREKVLGFYKPELKPDSTKMAVVVEASEYSIRNYGKTAVVITKLTFKVTANGVEIPPRSMRATIVFRNARGTWKIASAQYTGIRPATALKPGS